MKGRTEAPPRGSRRRSGASHGAPRPESEAAPEEPRERFLRTDAYRAEREWARYEGNALRDIFRQLRGRFLARHRADDGWSLDLGSGPGRFTRLIGRGPERTVQVDLALEMLREARSTPPRFHQVRGDARSPPFPPRAFRQVVAFGNVLGHSGSEADPTLQSIGSLVGPGGLLVVEVVPGRGERSHYFSRLPPGAVRRALDAPTVWLRSRIAREGFDAAARERSREHGFRRITSARVLSVLGEEWRPVETLAVAPALGFDIERLEAVRTDPASWAKLLELEETLGREPDRWAHAAALLMALERLPADSGPRV